MTSLRQVSFVLLATATLYFVSVKAYMPAIVTMIAALSYFGMILKQSGDGSTSTVLGYRYADWILTTPIILFVILKKAKFSMDYIAFIMAADVLMIATGYFAKLEKDPHKRQGWFVMGMVLFLPILYALYKSMGYTNASTLTLVIWLLYPIVWMLSDGNTITVTLENQIVSVMDVIAKVGFGLLL